MNTEHVTLELPGPLYEQLQALATAKETDVVSFIGELVTDAYKMKRGIENLNALAPFIKNDEDLEDLQLSDRQKETIVRLRQNRKKMFEQEYAHQERSGKL
ncbi:MAG: hypothetical protein GDA43_14090 [Hormoscilla sp. SP5CHS1]|nr:hypothetical protein [Hormoscilla sp. SP12CHS1]MBC6454179.1 hypothetical protein [Hormoscilla sp. SP5CHS1]